MARMNGPLENHVIVVIGPLFLIIGVGALVLNSLLLFLGLRISDRKLEINYAMLLAALDVLVPSVIIVNRTTFILSGVDLRLNPITCSVTGAFNYITLFLSLLLVMLIALERSCNVFSERVPAWIWYTLRGYVAFYTGLVVYLSANGDFVLSPSGINCTPLAHRSTLSATLLVLFGVSLLCFLFVTVGCYLRILRFVLHVKRENELTKGQFMPASRRNALPKVDTTPVTTRTMAICGIYFLLIFPSCLLLILLGVGVIHESLVSSLYISVMLFSISFANPALVIFAHSIIYEQLAFIITKFNY